MALTLSGDGTIAGLAAGGLPDLSIGTADIADAAITAAKLDGAQSGSAPIYGARAWVNFNGTSTVAIRASGNVTSITDNGTGDYTVNFTTAMSDANYAAAMVARGGSTQTAIMTENHDNQLRTTTQLRVYSLVGTTTPTDFLYNSVTIFR